MDNDAIVDGEENYRTAVDAINVFGGLLYSHVAADSGNLFFSPYSIHAALTLAYMGAKGETARQMASVLRWPIARQMHSASRIAIGQILDGLEPSLQLVMANALWAQAGIPLQSQFANACADAIHQVDFAADAEAVRRTINGWVKRQTRDKIRDMIPPGGVEPLSRLALTNAIYFRANWREEFEPSETREGPFYLADGTTVPVLMMHQIEDFHALVRDRFWAVNLFYEGFSMSMQLFVPRKIEDLPWLEKKVMETAPDDFMREMEGRRVDLTLPKFRIETSLRLERTLATMGMPTTFDPSSADFSGICDERWWLSTVSHKAYVDVNEEGTEAAGATHAMLAGGCGTDYRPLVIKVDRPFLFTITGHAMYSRAEALLFIGRVMNPMSP